MGHATGEQIDDYVALFDGDPVKAVLAIRERVQADVAHTPAPAYGPSIVQVQSLQKEYTRGKQTIHALGDVTLDIYEGEFVAITGPSGSGKSTLLQLIGCLDKPSGGSIIVNGKDVAKLSDKQLSTFRQQTVGFVFQSFYLQPFLRLADNIAVPSMFANESPKAIQTNVAALLESVGLSDRAAHFPHELSGGQVQRAAIARALINNPKIILADEPTGNLDTKNSREIIELFQQIRRDRGATVIVVTHNQEIARFADRVVTLKDGEVV